MVLPPNQLLMEAVTAHPLLMLMEAVTAHPLLMLMEAVTAHPLLMLPSLLKMWRWPQTLLPQTGMRQQQQGALQP